LPGCASSSPSLSSTLFRAVRTFSITAGPECATRRAGPRQQDDLARGQCVNT
jgi:hypothetical protein